MFDYHLKQHSSQTAVVVLEKLIKFDYHLKQHSSQTHGG